MKYLIAVLWPLTALSAPFTLQPCTNTTPTVTAASPAVTVALSCPQFDSSLGRLTDAVLVGYLEPIGGLNTITVRNDGTTVQNFTGRFDSFALIAVRRLTYPLQSARSVGDVLISVNGSVAPGETATLPMGLVFGPQINAAGGPDLSGYVGLGSIDLAVSITTRLYAPFPSQVAILDYSITFGTPISTMSLAYVYDPVPEPGTWTTAGIVLCAMVHRRTLRRR